MPLVQRLEQVTDISVDFAKSGVETSRLSDFQMETMKETVFELRQATGAYLAVCGKYLLSLIHI